MLWLAASVAAAAATATAAGWLDWTVADTYLAHSDSIEVVGRMFQIEFLRPVIAWVGGKEVDS